MNWATIFVWYLPIQFYFSQNNYFGWNVKPQTDMELIADGITLLLLALAALSSAVIAADRRLNNA